VLEPVLPGVVVVSVVSGERWVLLLLLLPPL